MAEDQQADKSLSAASHMTSRVHLTTRMISCHFMRKKAGILTHPVEEKGKSAPSFQGPQADDRGTTDPG